MSELLALVDIRDVYLDDGALETTDAVVQGDARVSIGPCIEHDAVIAACEPRLLHLVDELALDIALIVVYLHLRVAAAECREAVFHRFRAIDTWFPLPQQVQVWPVDNLYLHFFQLDLGVKIR